MAVLIDTSVWIRALAGKPEFVSGLSHALASEDVLGHEMILGELTIGDVGGRLKLLAEYEVLLMATSVPHNEVIQFVRHRRLHGHGIGWIDAHLLASSIVDRARFWTADLRLLAVANELNVAYSPKRP